MGPIVYKIFARALMLALVTTLAGAGFQAAQAQTQWSFMAYAGATQVRVLDATISSDYTAPSFIFGNSAGMHNANSTASVSAGGVLDVGAVETSVESFDTPEGIATRTVAQTADVNLLGGLIQADAVKTTITSYANDDGTSSATGNTEFVGLTIAGANLPITIPKNFHLGIPGVAWISANYFTTGAADGNRGSMAAGLAIHLLKPTGQLHQGATVTVNPAMSFLGPLPEPPVGARLAGQAYGTRVAADVGNGVIDVRSDRTAPVGTAIGGSDGETITKSTASVNVPGVLDIGAIESTSTSDKDGSGDTDDGWVTTTNEIAGINVLGGLITADAIKVTAHSEVSGGAYSGSMDMELVNLVVAGQAIPVNVGPNTEIEVPGLAKLVINEQVQADRANRVRAISIVLGGPQSGLPAGATIEVAVASTAIN